MKTPVEIWSLATAADIIRFLWVYLISKASVFVILTKKTYSCSSKKENKNLPEHQLFFFLWLKRLSRNICLILTRYHLLVCFWRKIPEMVTLHAIVLDSLPSLNAVWLQSKSFWRNLLPQFLPDCSESWLAVATCRWQHMFLTYFLNSPIHSSQS